MSSGSEGNRVAWWEATAGVVLLAAGLAMGVWAASGCLSPAGSPRTSEDQSRNQSQVQDRHDSQTFHVGGGSQAGE